MPRVKKDSVPISLKMDREIAESLNQYCADSGQAKTVAIERAVAEYVGNYYNKVKILKNFDD